MKTERLISFFLILIFSFILIFIAYPLFNTIPVEFLQPYLTVSSILAFLSILTILYQITNTSNINNINTESRPIKVYSDDFGIKYVKFNL